MAVRRAAVIGCGDISALHVAAIRSTPDVELVAVCDTDADRLRAAVEAIGAPGYDGHVTMFTEARPDVVHITTPHAAHAGIAIDALERGIHVILEKPLAHDIAAGERVVAAAAASTARIAVCFQNRYNAPVQRAHDVLSSGDLGAVHGAAATVLWHRTADYYRDRPWRGTWDGGGGGLLMNQAIHTLDLVQWLVGDIEAVVGGVSTRVLGDVIEVEDTADLVLHHRNGARSVFYATLANATNAPITVDITAEHGSLSLRGDLTITHADGSVEVVPENSVAAGERAYWGVSHGLLIQDFYSGLDHEGPFWIDAAEAMKTLTIIQNIYDHTYSVRPRRDAERSMTA